ncbi:hypothetical protein ACJJTC_001176 [Scirpophaga incertulas]
MMSTTEAELDVDVANEREEGELEDSDVEEGKYIPLTRPEAFDPPSLVHMKIQDELSDEASWSESSAPDSDDEPRRRPKRTKLKPRCPQPQEQTNKKDKYNVWCKTLQEDLLTQNMVSCDVTKKNADYGVESYDYTIKYRLDDNYVPRNVFSNNRSNSYQEGTNKRRHSDRGTVKLRLGKRVNSNCEHKPKTNPRILPDLTVNPEDSIEEIAKDIAEKLCEEKEELIGRIVEVLGVHKAIEIYKETQRVEADGGMLVMNGTRRRTPGGIYFFLLKRDNEVSQEMVMKIFNEDRRETARRIKKSRANTRQKVMEQLKQSLTDSELPSLLSRGEATVQSEHGSNPPPSPVTDARECSSDTDAPLSPLRPQSPLPDRTEQSVAVAEVNVRDPRDVQNYDDDDFLEVMCNEDMDMF